jgi:hypothetical protein
MTRKLASCSSRRLPRGADPFRRDRLACPFQYATRVAPMAQMLCGDSALPPASALLFGVRDQR